MEALAYQVRRRTALKKTTVHHPAIHQRQAAATGRRWRNRHFLPSAHFVLPRWQARTGVYLA